MDKNYNLLWGAMVGGAVGTLATMLFTTQKGKQICKAIAKKYKEFEGKVTEAAENVEEKVKGEAKEAAKKIKENFNA